MDCNSQRLNQGPLLQAYCLRKRCDSFRIHCKILRSHPRCLKSHNLQLLAKVIFTMAAGIAFSAYYLGLYGHFLADCKPRCTLSNLLDQARYFMALSDGIAGKWMFPMIDMDIRSTYTNIHNFNQYLSRFGIRYRHFVEFNLARGYHHLLQHRFHHMSASINHGQASRHLQG